MHHRMKLQYSAVKGATEKKTLNICFWLRTCPYMCLYLFFVKCTLAHFI